MSGPFSAQIQRALRAYGFPSPGVFSGSLATLTQAGIVTTSTDGLILQNTTAATAGVPVQQSPRLRWRSQVWNTTATAANNTNDWWIESVPVSGTTPSGLLKFGSSLNGAAVTFPMTLNSTGKMTLLDGIDANSNIRTTGNLQVGGTLGAPQVFIVPAGQNLARLSNGANDTGVGLDWATEDILKIRTRAQTGDATVWAKNLSLPNTGGAATSGQFTLGAGGTVVVPTTAATATALIFFQRVTNGGTIGFATTYTVIANTSFTPLSDNVLDRSVYNWWIVEVH